MTHLLAAKGVRKDDAAQFLETKGAGVDDTPEFDQEEQEEPYDALPGSDEPNAGDEADIDD